MSVSRFYDRLYGAVDLEEPDSHQAARMQKIEFAIRKAARRTPPPWRILEVGSGTGWLSGALRRYGSVTGVDLSEVGVDIARRRYPECAFTVRDLFADPFPPVHDLVVSSEVIEHVEDQQRFADLLSEATRPGGCLIVTTPNALVEEKWKGRPDYHPQPVENWLRPKRLRALLSRGGRVIWMTTFFYDFDRAGIHRLIHYPQVERLDRLWGHLGLGLYTIALAERR